VTGNVQPVFVPTQHQLVDIFTKALAKTRYDTFLHKLGIRDLHAPT